MWCSFLRYYERTRSFLKEHEEVNVKTVYRLLQVPVAVGYKVGTFNFKAHLAAVIKVECSFSQKDSRTCFAMNNSHHILKVVMRQTQCIVNEQQQICPCSRYLLLLLNTRIGFLFIFFCFLGPLEK